MSTLSKVHILDADSARRAKIAFGLASSSIQAEIYENLEELLGWTPRDGLLLVNDNDCDDAIARIGERVADTGGYLPIAMYGEKPSTTRVVQAMLAGAVDYLEWPFEAEQLNATMTRVASEAEQQLRAARRTAEAQNALKPLSPREHQVLRAMVAGSSNKQIAIELKISPRTVEIHRSNLLSKLNAQSSSEAIRIGIYAGLDQ